MTTGAAWSALTERFASLASDHPIHYGNCGIHTSEFDHEVNVFRLYYAVCTGSEPTGLITLKSESTTPMSRMASANRFRWLCWAAGILGNPYEGFRPPEVVWLASLTHKDETSVPDIVRRSAEMAGRHAIENCASATMPEYQRKAEWWNQKKGDFARLRERFAAAQFHGANLHMDVGDRFTDHGESPNHEYDRYVEVDLLRYANTNKTITRTGGLWGDADAVAEFRVLCQTALRILPNEFTGGAGPELFPSLSRPNQLDPTANWSRWPELMWVLCPSHFEIHGATDRSAPYLTAIGCPAQIAASACDHIAVSGDAQRFLQEYRVALARFNPWLDHDENRAVALAIEAAYQKISPSQMVPHLEAPPSTQLQPEQPKRDGPEPGGWIRLNGKCHKIESDLIWKLISFFWDKELAHFDDLVGDDRPWQDPVGNGAISTAATRLKATAAQIGLPWKLTVNASLRCVSKVAR